MRRRFWTELVWGWVLRATEEFSIGHTWEWMQAQCPAVCSTPNCPPHLPPTPAYMCQALQRKRAQEIATVIRLSPMPEPEPKPKPVAKSEPEPKPEPNPKPEPKSKPQAQASSLSLSLSLKPKPQA